MTSALIWAITSSISSRRGLIAEIWTGPKVNEIAHPTLASDGAEMLLRLAEHDESGIFHCWGSEAVSRLQLAYHMADIFAVDRTLIVPVPTDPFVLDRYRHVRIPFRIVASNEKDLPRPGPADLRHP